MKPTPHIPALLLFVVSCLVPVQAPAETWHCGFRDGVPDYRITKGKPAPGCRLISKPRTSRWSAPGARCTTRRYGKTRIRCCEKDGIRSCFGRDVGRRAVGASTANVHGRKDRSTKGGASANPVPVGEVYGGTEDMDVIIARASTAHEVPKALIKAVIYIESRFNADAVSAVGAQGLMQLMPVTADYLDVSDPFDPEQNVMAGTRLLRRLANRYDGDLELTLAAYYAGPNAVKRAGGIPTDQCASYVGKVIEQYREYSQ